MRCHIPLLIMLVPVGISVICGQSLGWMGGYNAQTAESPTASWHAPGVVSANVRQRGSFANLLRDENTFSLSSSEPSSHLCRGFHFHSSLLSLSWASLEKPPTLCKSPLQAPVYEGG